MVDLHRLTRADLDALYAEIRREVDAEEMRRAGRRYDHTVGGLVNLFTPEVPHGWIQWKGTDVCMDIRCECGCLHHIDADFAYNIKTPCGRIYSVGAHVPLFLVSADEVGEHAMVRECADETWDADGCRCADD